MATGLLPIAAELIVALDAGRERQRDRERAELPAAPVDVTPTEHTAQVAELLRASRSV